MSAAISVYYAMRYLELCAAQESAQQSAEQEVSCQAQVQMMPDSDYRKKREPVYRCDDGHYVRSKNEQLVDNWLYYHRICHGYEPMVWTGATEETSPAIFTCRNTTCIWKSGE